jgi:ribosome biogenesis ATPase
MSGESEKNIRALFNTAKTVEPCLIFIDEIDAISPKRESASKEMERRIVATLLTSFDGGYHYVDEAFMYLDLSDFGQTHRRVIVIGATNRLDSLDPSLRRSGRFDREISLGIVVTLLLHNISRRSR